MLYWSLIFFSLVICALWATLGGNKGRREALFVLCILLIYFSSFRMGLGMDYEGYLNKMNWESTGVINWINEPLISLLAILIDNTHLTPLFFFMVCSLITIPCLFSYFGRNDNSFVFCSVAIFVLLPILFFNTFNIVRQFTATSLFFFALKYIERRKFLLYLLCILLAISLHLTALLLLPLYFIINKKYRISVLLVSFVGFFVLFSLAYPLIETYAILDSRFSVYLETEQQMGASGMIILYNLMGLIMLFKRQAFKTSIDIISYNLFFLFILFSDLSFVNFYFFRIAVYFSPAFAFVFPKLVGSFIGRKNTIVVSWAFSLLFFIPFILSNLNNPIVVPEGILPFSALWDASEYQIVYSINP